MGIVYVYTRRGRVYRGKRKVNMYRGGVSHQ
jgi:hypothetical protein